MTVPTPVLSATARPLPSHADLVDYNHAVAGHDGVLSDASGELFIKPCTASEIAFYEQSYADHPDFAEHMPTFVGTLKLSAEQNASIEQQGAALLHEHHGLTAVAMRDAPAAAVVAKHSVPDPAPSSKRKISTDTALVLENAAHGFVRPNILDVKLGVRLWADDAAQAKKDRFDDITANTTHKNLGFRIAGMRVWQGADAPRGENIDEDGFMIYDKDYGRFSVNDDNVRDAFRSFLACERAGVDDELSKLVSEAFLIEAERIQAVLERQESRMYSASLLFLYEGDGTALRAAMEAASRTPPASADDDDDDESDQTPKIYSLKVIDFAHAQWTPGMGPDENSLLGVRSVAKILRDIIGTTGA